MHVCTSLDCWSACERGEGGRGGDQGGGRPEVERSRDRAHNFEYYAMDVGCEAEITEICMEFGSESRRSHTDLEPAQPRAYTRAPVACVPDEATSPPTTTMSRRTAPRYRSDPSLARDSYAGLFVVTPDV